MRTPPLNWGKIKERFEAAWPGSSRMYWRSPSRCPLFCVNVALISE